MPEGDTIYRAARTLNLALAGQTVTSFESVLPHLSRVEIDRGITGRIIEKAEARGKWLLIHFSGDLILLSHMLMSGSWHIYRPGEKWKRKRYGMRRCWYGENSRRGVQRTYRGVSYFRNVGAPGRIQFPRSFRFSEGI